MNIKNLWDKTYGLFRSKTIDGVTLEDLERDKNRLQGEREKLQGEADGIETKERQLLEEGRAAPNDAMKRRIASKIKDGRDRKKTLEQRLSVIAKSLRIVTGLHTVKENETFYKSSGLGNALAGIPLANIVAYIEKAPAGVEATVDGMRDIIESLADYGSTMDSAVGDSGADRDLDDIMSEFDASEPEAASQQSAAHPNSSGAVPEISPTDLLKSEEK